MAFDFGVTHRQSAARQALQEAGDPRLQGIDVGAYRPGAGLKETRGAVSLSYLTTERSRVVLFAQGTRLSAEAARSPLVRDRTGLVTGAAIGYGF
jgi:outer membrane scaffolding protein for murein synthesis (MipA/OmpV family)